MGMAGNHPTAGLLTPVGPSGSAIAIVQIMSTSGEALDNVLAHFGCGSCSVGTPRLCEFPGGDTGLFMRVSGTCAQFMPHGGRVVLGRMRRALSKRVQWVSQTQPVDALSMYPEADGLIEACALETISQAASPRAIEVILEHAQRWNQSLHKHDAHSVDSSTAQSLHHLIEPPTVVLVGFSNIGKSSLTNAMARRCVSLFADEPGTTLDHVGVTIEVDGLVLRLVDTPGLQSSDPDPIVRQAYASTLSVIRNADLILVCGDAASGFIDLEATLGDVSPKCVCIGLRSDLGEAAGAKVQTSVIAGEGRKALAKLISSALVPPDAIAAPGVWRFHPQLPDLPSA